MLRRLLINKKLLVIVPVALVLALTGLFLPAKKVSIEPFGMLSIESKIVISVGSEAAYAASTLALYPGTAVSTATGIYVDAPWINPTNVSVDDSTNADIGGAALDSGGFTERLDATNFGFAIPTGSTIDGIVLEYDRFSPDVGTDVSDALVQLIQGGTPAGNNNSAGAGWALTETTVTFGTSVDLWGLTWTAADINAIDFGVAVAVTTSKNNCEAEIDFLRITVHYSPSITNAPTEINFGTVYTSTDYWAYGGTTAPNFPLAGGECFFEVTNLTAVAVDIDINSTHFSGGIAGGGWDIGTTAGTDVVVLRAGESGIANEGLMKTLTTVDQDFILGLAASPSNTRMWELKMETPSSFSNADVKTATITLTASLSP